MQRLLVGRMQVTRHAYVQNNNCCARLRTSWGGDKTQPMDYANHLIERIVSAPQHERVGILSNELLREFQRGHPLDDLRPLLRSDDGDVIATAIWITSELGEKCRPLLSDVVPLLAHPLKRIRFWALDCLYWTVPKDGCNLVEAFKLLEDPEPGVRWKALDVLSRLSKEQVQAAASCLDAKSSDSPHLQQLRWLISSDASRPDGIKSTLRSADQIVRKYGVAAAARLRKEHPELLVYASNLDDPDVGKFASDLLAV